MPARKKVRKGLRFERLVVDKLIGKTRGGKRLWLCRCDCGGNATVPSDNLLRPNSGSCGCLREVETSYRVEERESREMAEALRLGESAATVARRYGVSVQTAYAHGKKWAELCEERQAPPQPGSTSGVDVPAPTQAVGASSADRASETPATRGSKVRAAHAAHSRTQR